MALYVNGSFWTAQKRRFCPTGGPAVRMGCRVVSRDSQAQIPWSVAANERQFPPKPSSRQNPATCSGSKPQGEVDMAIQYDEKLHAERSPWKIMLEHSVLLVFMCTLIGAAAQILLKIGATQLTSSNPLRMLMNPWLFSGYALYGMSTVLLILALRKGQLSLLYPVISLTYVWVTILSLLIFKESMNVYKVVGLSVVVAGVAVLGRDARA